MATPEHLLRAGRLPVWLDLDLSATAEQVGAQVRSRLAAARADYEEYHRRHAAPGERPLDDWAKVVLAPGLGLITAFIDKRSAVTANLCYRATLEAIANAEAVERFQFLPERDVFEFEHWPLERRKVEESIARERATQELPRHIVVVIGGGSGIGQAAARRFAEEGAHVVVADLEGEVADAVAAEIAAAYPGRAVGCAADVRDDASLDALFRRAVLEFGGLDCLFYTAGLPPRFAPVTDIRREDLQRQLEVHYLGAVAAIGRAAGIMRRQGIGGSIVASVSKAALVPGREAVAYGGSKAALLQALRVAAVELGGDGIRVNAINADQVDTPLFRRFVRERAASRGRDGGGAAGDLPQAEPAGGLADSGGGGGGAGGPAGERAVPVHHRGHPDGGRGLGGGVSEVMAARWGGDARGNPQRRWARGLGPPHKPTVLRPGPPRPPPLRIP